MNNPNPSIAPILFDIYLQIKSPDRTILNKHNFCIFIHTSSYQNLYKTQEGFHYIFSCALLKDPLRSDQRQICLRQIMFLFYSFIFILSALRTLVISGIIHLKMSLRVLLQHVIINKTEI